MAGTGITLLAAIAQFVKGLPNARYSKLLIVCGTASDNRAAQGVYWQTGRVAS